MRRVRERTPTTTITITRRIGQGPDELPKLAWQTFRDSVFAHVGDHDGTIIFVGEGIRNIEGTLVPAISVIFEGGNVNAIRKGLPTLADTFSQDEILVSEGYSGREVPTIEGTVTNFQEYKRRRYELQKNEKGLDKARKA